MVAKIIKIIALIVVSTATYQLYQYNKGMEKWAEEYTRVFEEMQSGKENTYITGYGSLWIASSTNATITPEAAFIAQPVKVTPNPKYQKPCTVYRFANESVCK